MMAGMPGASRDPNTVILQVAALSSFFDHDTGVLPAPGCADTGRNDETDETVRIRQSVNVRRREKSDRRAAATRPGGTITNLGRVDPTDTQRRPGMRETGQAGASRLLTPGSLTRFGCGHIAGAEDDLVGGQRAVG